MFKTHLYTFNCDASHILYFINMIFYDKSIPCINYHRGKEVRRYSYLLKSKKQFLILQHNELPLLQDVRHIKLNSINKYQSFYALILYKYYSLSM